MHTQVRYDTHMRKLWAGIGSLILSGLWWLIDKAYGDQLFAAIKPLFPADWLVLQNATNFALSYGPTVALLLVGAWLIYADETAPTKAAAVSAPPEIGTLWFKGLCTA
jgi:hypothetical protein